MGSSCDTQRLWKVTEWRPRTGKEADAVREPVGEMIWRRQLGKTGYRPNSMEKLRGRVYPEMEFISAAMMMMIDFPDFGILIFQNNCFTYLHVFLNL